MPFKIVCTDIDGTLLDSRRELSDLTIQTFRNLPDSVTVILASSRMPSAMTHLQAQLGIERSPLICYNGGYVLGFNGGDSPEVIYSSFIPADVCERIVAMAAQTDIHVSLYFQDQWYAPRWDHWTEREARITKVEPIIASNTEVLSRWKVEKIGGHKVMCMGPEDQISAMEEQLNMTCVNDIHIYRSRPTYLELAPRIISKGSALKLLEERLSFSSMDVIAFGDNYNDIELLKFAGKGIAVSNARKEVIDVADEITLDSQQDGVAIALKKYWDINN